MGNIEMGYCRIAYCAFQWHCSPKKYMKQNIFYRKVEVFNNKSSY